MANALVLNSHPGPHLHSLNEAEATGSSSGRGFLVDGVLARTPSYLITTATPLPGAAAPALFRGSGK